MRRKNRTGPEQVVVNFSAGGITGVEIVLGPRATHHADGRSQGGVERALPEGRLRALIGNIGVGDLAEGMNPGVGAAGAMDVDLMAAGQTGESFLQDVLHGAPAGLTLPTTESGAVVGQGQLKSHGARSSQLCRRICAAT